MVCPEAGLKLFVTASAEERARRRYAELRERGEWRMFGEVVADLAARDGRDSSREEAPLRMADDAIRIDTTGVPAEQVLDRALRLAEERLGRAGSEKVNQGAAFRRKASEKGNATAAWL